MDYKDAKVTPAPRKVFGFNPAATAFTPSIPTGSTLSDNQSFYSAQSDNQSFLSALTDPHNLFTARTAAGTAFNTPEQVMSNVDIWRECDPEDYLNSPLANRQLNSQHNLAMQGQQSSPQLPMATNALDHLRPNQFMSNSAVDFFQHDRLTCANNIDTQQHSQIMDTITFDPRKVNQATDVSKFNTPHIASPPQNSYQTFDLNLLSRALNKPVTAVALARHMGHDSSTPAQSMTSRTVLDLQMSVGMVRADSKQARLLSGTEESCASSNGLIDFSNVPRGPIAVRQPHGSVSRQLFTEGNQGIQPGLQTIHENMVFDSPLTASTSGQSSSQHVTPDIGGRTSRYKKTFQGPEPSSADVFPDDSDWTPVRKSSSKRGPPLLVKPSPNRPNVQDTSLWPTPAEGSIIQPSLRTRKQAPPPRSSAQILTELFPAVQPSEAEPHSIYEQPEPREPLLADEISPGSQRLFTEHRRTVEQHVPVESLSPAKQRLTVEQQPHREEQVEHGLSVETASSLEQHRSLEHLASENQSLLTLRSALLERYPNHRQDGEQTQTQPLRSTVKHSTIQSQLPCRPDLQAQQSPQLKHYLRAQQVSQDIQAPNHSQLLNNQLYFLQLQLQQKEHNQQQEHQYHQRQPPNQLVRNQQLPQIQIQQHPQHMNVLQQAFRNEQTLQRGTSSQHLSTSESLKTERSHQDQQNVHSQQLRLDQEHLRLQQARSIQPSLTSQQLLRAQHPGRSSEQTLLQVSRAQQPIQDKNFLSIEHSPRQRSRFFSADAIYEPALLDGAIAMQEFLSTRRTRFEHGFSETLADDRPLSPGQEDGSRYGLKFHGLAIGASGDTWDPQPVEEGRLFRIRPRNHDGWGGWAWALREGRTKQ